jgi:hypothetical protein
VKLAIMQPYFFPYIGYWQLLRAVDTFILFDDVQYMRPGWINRNRILKPAEGWQYIVVPLQAHSHKELIRNILAHDRQNWKEQIIAQLAHYKRKAPYFSVVLELIKATLYSVTDHRMAYINFAVINNINRALDIKTKVLLSSECNFNYTDVKAAGDWALQISQQMHAQQYINPISGASLYNIGEFRRSGIQLTLLAPNAIKYPQAGQFEPSLSIIDVLMFNGIENTKLLLNEFSLREATA